METKSNGICIDKALINYILDRHDFFLSWKENFLVIWEFLVDKKTMERDLGLIYLFNDLDRFIFC